MSDWKTDLTGGIETAYGNETRKETTDQFISRCRSVEFKRIVAQGIPRAPAEAMVLRDVLKRLTVCIDLTAEQFAYIWSGGVPDQANWIG